MKDHFIRIDNRTDVYFGGFNITGSIKDIAAKSIFEDALKRGLTKDYCLIDASSGNFACAMALIAKQHGYDCEMYVNSSISEGKQKFLNAMGVTWQVGGERTIDAHYAVVDRIESGEKKYWHLDQLHNPTNPEGYREIARHAPERQYQNVIGTLGSGGCMYGLLCEYEDTANFITVESNSGTKIAGCGAFVDGDYETHFVKQMRKMAYNETMISMTEAIIGKEEMHILGIPCGIQGGAVYRAWRRYRHMFGGKTLLIIGDHVWKN